MIECKAVPRERWTLLCTVCKSRMGAKIQCDGNNQNCYLAYHPLCARAAGFKMEHTLLDPTNPDSGIRSVSFCQRHFPPDQARVTLVRWKPLKTRTPAYLSTALV